MLHLPLYDLCVSLTPSPRCNRQWAQSLLMCYHSARVGLGDVKCEPNLEKWTEENISHNFICGLPKYSSFSSFFKRIGLSLTASHSVKPPLQPGGSHETRSCHSNVSFDLEMNSVSGSAGHPFHRWHRGVDAVWVTAEAMWPWRWQQQPFSCQASPWGISRKCF